MVPLLKTNAAEERALPCPICFKTCSGRLELDAHMDTHPDSTLRCARVHAYTRARTHVAWAASVKVSPLRCSQVRLVLSFVPHPPQPVASQRRRPQAPPPRSQRPTVHPDQSVHPGRLQRPGLHGLLLQDVRPRGAGQFPAVAVVFRKAGLPFGG